MTSDHADDPRIVTPLTSLLGIEHPILSAPMGDTAGGRLAAAVSAAGALGLIGGGYADPDWLESQLELADGARVGVGFITFALAERPDALRVALDAEPVAIQLSFGDPRPFAETIHASGALLICQVQTSTEISLAVEAKADVIVVQGGDAGGHGRPGRGTIGLVPSAVDRVAPIPVVAAGGIADGRGLAAALMLGASGIALGTRFLAAREAISNAAEAEAIVAGRTDDTVRTDVFDLVRGPAWPPGHDGRVLRNRLVEMWETSRDEAQARSTYRDAAPEDHSIRPVWAGEGVDLIAAIEPAATIVERVVRDAVRRLELSTRLVTTTSTPTSKADGV